MNQEKNRESKWYCDDVINPMNHDVLDQCKLFTNYNHNNSNHNDNSYLLKNNKNRKEIRYFNNIEDCYNGCEKPAELRKSLKENKLPMINTAIMFTDIKGSSALWKKNQQEMYIALQLHEEQINRLVKKYNGTIIKTIGDAYMIAFLENDNNNNNDNLNYCNHCNHCNHSNRKQIDRLKRSINLALALQEELTNDSKAIYIDKERLKVRIGIAYGPVYSKMSIIQNNISVLDFFGNTVNTASRAESKVAIPDGFAFSILNNKKMNLDMNSEIESILALIPDHFQIEKRSYLTSCKAPNLQRTNRGRSGRLVAVQCYDINELKGIEEVIIYKVNFNPARI